MTEATRNILQCFPMFDIALRGVVPVKGKGDMTTYWLVGPEPKTPSNSLTAIQTPAAV